MSLCLRDLFGRAEKGHILVLGRESLPSLTFSRFYDFPREICSAVHSSATNGGVSFTGERAKNAAGMEGSMVVSRSPAAARMVLRARHADADAAAAIELQKGAIDGNKLCLHGLELFI